MPKVFLGIGHGRADCGAIGNGLKEKDLNLSIGLACRDELKRHGVTVKMSREKDETDPLKDEIRECNVFKPDLALDIHNNAGGGDGAEIYHHYAGGKSKTLAQNILNSICGETGQNSRGLKVRKNIWGKDYFGFIREIKAPAVIVECAFIDSKDVQIIDIAAEKKKMGIAIAHGVLKTLGVAIKSQSEANNNAQTKPQNKPTSASPSKTTGSAVNSVVLKWQKAAIADGYKFPKSGADGKWGSECVSVAQKAICKKSVFYKNKNLTRIIQKKVGVTADGKFGNNTRNAVIKWQKANGLTADGCVGINTWKKILGV